jgi:hypothetical protein
LESTVFLNRNDHFDARPLPIEAQFAPAFGLCAADADGDGHIDLFLAQNFFALQPETSRHDGGRGLWLLGDGQGGFTSLPGSASGVKLYGEARGAAVADIDNDGRIDLAVGQNGHRTALFHNRRATPGLIVRLIGPPQNPNAIGTVARARAIDRRGAAQLWSAGSGYLSQDGQHKIFTSPEPLTHLAVTWMNGEQREYELPADASKRSVTVHFEHGLISDSP